MKTITTLFALGLGAAACSGSDTIIPYAPPCTPTAGQICTIAGTGVSGFSGDQDSALYADLSTPVDLTFASDGTGYLLDWNNHRIRALKADGTIDTIAGSGYLGDGPAGPAKLAAFNHPTHIAIDAQGRLVVAAWHNSKLKRIDLSTGQMEDICGTGARNYAGEGGPAKTAILDLPVAVVFDSKGNTIIMDQANQMLRKVDAADNITRIGGKCVIEPKGSPVEDSICTADAAPIQCTNNSKTTCQDKAKWDEWIAKPENATAQNQFCATTCTGGFAGDGGPALDARFNLGVGQNADPNGRIAIDSKDNLYIADTRNHRIRKVDAATGIITTIAGKGTAGYSGDGGPATAAELNYPVDVEVAEDGTLFIADTKNHCIRKIDASGNISTAAGQCGKKGFEGDGGDPTKARLNVPYGISLKGKDLYIADSLNNRIRVVPGL